MIINFIKLDKSVEKIIHNATLIDFVYDECKDNPIFIFNSDPTKCCAKNTIDTEDKEAMISSDYDEVTIVETPAGGALLVTALLSVIAVAVAAYVYFSFEVPETGATQQGSNNQIGSRQNVERPMQRIEDIAGKVRSYPTLIQETYKKFDTASNEVEYSLMAISKGEGEITSVRDGETPLSAINNAGACFYAPNTLASRDTPFKVVGQDFTEEVKIIKRSNEVSGSSVFDYKESFVSEFPSNSCEATLLSVGGNGTFVADENNTTSSFDKFEAGDIISISYLYAPFKTLNGTYVIVSVSTDFLTIEVDNPNGGGVESVNPNWIDMISGDISLARSTFTLESYVERTFLGPYFLASENREEYFFNVVANGLQKDDGGTITVEWITEYSQADEEGNQIGPWISGGGDLLRNGNRDRIGKTTSVVTDFVGPCLVRMRRTTNKIGDAVLQDIKLDALYSVDPITISDFGDVTTVQVRVIANSSSTQVKERKFNCLFERKLNLVQPDGTLGAFEPTRRFIDYFVYASLEPKIGRRTANEIDIKDIYDNYAELLAYFGSDEFSYFDYTFDSDQVSLQDILATICQPSFCKAIRKNGRLTTRNILPEEPSTIFTHRNKVAQKQTITRTFQSDGTKDGVEYQYVDPDTDSVFTIEIPQDGSASNPEKVNSTGVRNHNKAWWNAWRRFNQIKAQRINMQDTLTADGALLNVNDVVAVTNNTKGMPQSGEVKGVQGLLLTLSEPVDFSDTGAVYSITLRKRDGSLETIGCNAGIDSNQVVLNSAPSEEIYTGYDEERTVFIFNKDGLADADKYIITEIDRSDLYEIPITAINYSDKYYERDGEPSPYN